MAAYNDLIALAEWASVEKYLADEEANNIIRIDRRFLKLRMIASFFYEALNVLEELEHEQIFKAKLANKLSEEGAKALKRLRAVRCGRDPAIRHLLDRTRNLATFHYLREPYQKALAGMSISHRLFSVVIRYEPGDARRWYPLAEHLKLETAFAIGTTDAGSLLDTFETITQRLDDMALVLDELCDRYKKWRGLRTLPGKQPRVGR